MIATIVIDTHTMEPRLLMSIDDPPPDFDEAVSYWTRSALVNEGFVFIVFDDEDEEKQQIITCPDVKVERLPGDDGKLDLKDFL